MKKLSNILLTGLILLLFVALNTSYSFGQKKTEKTNPVPEDINLILQPFCYSCHGPGGGRLPHSKLNFAVWNGYPPGKQVEKAASICASMKKGTMPTKLWKQQNPGMRLTNEQINTVCNWAESMKEAEKNRHRVTRPKSSI